MALLATPPGVVTEIFPVTAPVGTVVVICVSEFTVNVAALLANLTEVVPVKLVPVRITCVPTAPLGGAKLMRAGTILKINGETRLPPGSLTVITPVVAPVAGLAFMKVLPVTVNVPAPAPNNTCVAVERFCPRIPTDAPTLACFRGTGWMNDFSPAAKL